MRGIGDAIYIVYTTGSQPVCATPCDPFATDFAVLMRFDQKARSFATLRELSAAPDGGHFVYTALHSMAAGPAGIGQDTVPMFGIGNYRGSNVYLVLVPQQHFATGIGTRYLTGLDGNGRPIRTAPATSGREVLGNRTQAQPVVVDDAPSPSIGNLSVAYQPALGLWLITYVVQTVILWDNRSSKFPQSRLTIMGLREARPVQCRRRVGPDHAPSMSKSAILIHILCSPSDREAEHEAARISPIRRWHGGGVAARGARAAEGDAGDRLPR